VTDYETPMVDAVREARSQNRHPLLVPGHKFQYTRDVGAIGHDLLHDLVRDDMPMQGGADHTSMKGGYLDAAEGLYARAIGADHTRFLVGGSSQGNISGLLTVAHPDRPIAVDRTSHRSALAGLVLSGAMPEWIFPRVHPDWGIPIGIDPAAVAALRPDVTAVFVTSPSYVGTISDIAALADAAHALGVPLEVDQAWGAHLDFMPGRGSFALGADLVVTSVHKALMGYSATAVVSCRGDRVDRFRMDRSVDITATTSPSATLLASIDATRAVMQAEGLAAIERTIEAVAQARATLRAVPGVTVIDDETAGVPVDPTKLTLWLPPTGVTGTALSDALWERHYAVESADSDTIVMTMTVADSPEWIRWVGGFVAELIEGLRGSPRSPAPAATWTTHPDVVITPREAVFAPRRRIPLDQAVGEISAEQFCPYPPGVPLLGPGERVTADLVRDIRTAGRMGRVAYCSDPSLETIEVVDS